MTYLKDLCSRVTKKNTERILRVAFLNGYLEGKKSNTNLAGIPNAHALFENWAYEYMAKYYDMLNKGELKNDSTL